jgi:adenine phosphoribosyltransferase
MSSIAKLVESKIRKVPDFPKAGVMFKDITPALKDAETLAMIVDWFVDNLKDKNIDYVAGLEARGFLFAPLVAYKLGVGFIPIRKPGKLPAEVEKVSYALEYGEDSLEIHKDAVEPGKRVAIIDDVLATGGTAAAAEELIIKIGGHVAASAFLIELCKLNGRRKLTKHTEILSLIES